jgi:hypothetical protein
LKFVVFTADRAPISLETAFNAKHEVAKL